MTRLGAVWTATVFAVSGFLMGAAVTFRWLSQGSERLVTP